MGVWKGSKRKVGRGFYGDMTGHAVRRPVARAVLFWNNAVQYERRHC